MNNKVATVLKRKSVIEAEKQLIRGEKGDKGDKPKILMGKGSPSEDLEADIYFDKESGELWLNV